MPSDEVLEEEAARPQGGQPDSVDQLELEGWIDELDLREAIQEAQRYEL